ncbi:hypothetical protein BU15DRAFT_63541 [Melanogaster broomeanus]|nr:hypothetical protein BU15DRAFT_63541 [Melanogaster broomeanus]
MTISPRAIGCSTPALREDIASVSVPHSQSITAGFIQALANIARASPSVELARDCVKLGRKTSLRAPPEEVDGPAFVVEPEGAGSGKEGSRPQMHSSPPPPSAAVTRVSRLLLHGNTLRIGSELPGPQGIKVMLSSSHLIVDVPHLSSAQVGSLQAAVNGDDQTLMVPSILPCRSHNEAIFGGECTERP